MSTVDARFPDNSKPAPRVASSVDELSMQFFNFTNEETFHFFKWVTDSGQVDPKALIEEADSSVEADTEHFEEEAICVVARDILARPLYVLLEDALEPLHGTLADAAEAEVGNVWNSKELLWLPLLALAAVRVDCGATAQALLIRAGKWAPDKDLPDIR